MQISDQILDHCAKSRNVGFRMHTVHSMAWMYPRWTVEARALGTSDLNGIFGGSCEIARDRARSCWIVLDRAGSCWI
eukprot:620949-Prymnesium_polylepis.1